jgi:GntR family transcriptional regulator
MLAQVLRDSIRQGRLHPGQRLPGENELAELFGVSRTTLRAAVQTLLTQGILERRHGVGTFVAKTNLILIEEGLESLISTTAVIRQHGYEPGTSQLRSEIIPAPPEISTILELAPTAPLFHISRTRTANQKPVIQAEEYISTSILNADLLSVQHKDWSLYKLLQEIGKPVTTALCRVKAISADKQQSHQLRVPLRHPLLLLRQIHFTEDHRPVLYCENYHNSSIIEFQLLRRS